LSGSKDEISSACVIAKELGIKRAIPLATAGAFHSRFMQSAREKLAPVLDSISFRAPKIPVLSNITGKPHSSDGSEIRALMLEQVTGTTNWAADVEMAKQMGATRFIEFGPGKVLSGLVKKIDPSLEAFSVPDVASLEAVAAL
jgi:[acyl-carrier-protein] S-malonyltransferase